MDLCTRQKTLQVVLLKENNQLPETVTVRLYCMVRVRVRRFDLRWKKENNAVLTSRKQTRVKTQQVSLRWLGGLIYFKLSCFVCISPSLLLYSYLIKHHTQTEISITHDLKLECSFLLWCDFKISGWKFPQCKVRISSVFFIRWFGQIVFWVIVTGASGTAEWAAKSHFSWLSSTPSRSLRDCCCVFFFFLFFCKTAC